MNYNYTTNACLEFEGFFETPDIRILNSISKHTHLKMFFL